MNFPGTYDVFKFFTESRQNVTLQGASLGQREALVFQAAMRAAEGPVVIVTHGTKQQNRWLDLLDQWLSNETFSEKCDVAVLPYFSGWGSDRYVNPIMMRKQRMEALTKCLVRDKQLIVVTTLEGLAQKTISKEALGKEIFKLSVHQEIDFDELTERLISLGYREERQVDENATFAVRGSVIDVFPPHCHDPIRIEIMIDKIKSLRSFSIANQRTLKEEKIVHIGPAQEILPSRENKKETVQRIYDYMVEHDISRSDREGWLEAFQLSVRFPSYDLLAPLVAPHFASAQSFFGEGCTYFIDDALEGLQEHFSSFIEEMSKRHTQDLATNKLTFDPKEYFLSLDEVMAFFEVGQAIRFGLGSLDKVEDAHSISMSELGAKCLALQSQSDSKFENWAKQISAILDEGFKVVVGLRHQDHFERIHSLFEHQSLDLVREKFLPFIGMNPKSALIAALFDFSDVLFEPTLNHVYIPETALFGHAQVRRVRRAGKLQNYLNSFKDLKTGDLVVHLTHGIARYLGMQNLKVGQTEAEFLILEYKGGDKIYLPIDKLNLLQKYSSGEGGSFAIDSLKSKNWQNRKSRVRSSIRDMAEKLLQLYAKRKMNAGVAYSAPSEDYFRFENMFPYEETEDQLRVISEVNFDLSSQNPMDRLVCGDVGFGKTEVALRAAFRVASDHFQVVVLVPTTVLSYQHYRQFHERLSPFGLEVAALNRFVPAAQQKEVLRKFAEGRIDVLVGTHRVLSQDVKAQRLGLVIIDEEQRFGVAHKEKLKELRASCDVLTLTATPIPRTLHLSMIGLRDISIMSTPPSDRLYVKTYISKFDAELVRDAIERELSRGGQVFYVHNRVEDIAGVAEYLKSLVPSARIRFAHGQMAERQLEDVIIEFINQKFDVLVCTTIIESGIDMPNVNTLIVNDAHRFGLAQLYQIRGRVGRSSRQAFAYFLTPPQERISEDGMKRLEILAAHQELGSGFQIAAHDMELRGVGSLLSAEQSGKIADVGLELYTEMLESTIRELQGKQEYTEKRDVEIKIPVTPFIPRTYIQEENLRLQLYKALFSCDEESSLAALRDETKDKYGSFDEDVETVFRMAELKLLLIRCNVTRLTSKGAANYEVEFGKLSEQQIDGLIKVCSLKPQHYRLTPRYQLFLSSVGRPSGGEGAGGLSLLQELMRALQPISQAFLESARS